MEYLRSDDPPALGPYRLVARLAPAGGERRWLAVGPAGHPYVEVTLLEGESGDGLTLLRGAAAGPGLVEAVDADPGAEPPWLACRYVPSLTLAEVGGLMYGGLPDATVRGIGAALAAALARLHAAGAAHGAVSPGGVLLGAGGPRLVRPRGKGSPADDVAALATVLTDAAAGRPPDTELLARCRHADPGQRPTAAELAAHWNPGTPPPLPARIVGALAREAEEALAQEGLPRPGASHGGHLPEGRRAADAGRVSEAAGASDGSRAVERARESEAVRAAEAPGSPAVPPTGLHAPHEPEAHPRPHAPSAAPQGRAADAAPAATPGSEAPPLATTPARSPHRPARPAHPTRRTLLTASAGALLGAGAVGGWVMARGGADALASPERRTRAASSGTARVPRGAAPPALWRYDNEAGPIKADVSMWGGETGYVSEPPFLTALRLDTGQVAWTRDDMAAAQPVLPLADQAVTARSERLVGLSPKDGKQLWTRTMSVLSGRGTMRILGGSSRDRTVLCHVAPPSGATGDDRQPWLVNFGVDERADRWRMKVTTALPGDLRVTSPDAEGEEEEEEEAGAQGGQEQEHEHEQDRDLYLIGRRYPRSSRLTRADIATGRTVWNHIHPWTDTFRATLVYDPYSRQLIEVVGGRLRAAPHDADAPRHRLDLFQNTAGTKPDKVTLSSKVRRIKGVGSPLLFVASPAQTVIAVDTARVREFWRHRLTPDRLSKDPAPPVLRVTDSGRTLLAASRFGVFALDSRTGAEQWHFAVADADESYQVHTSGRVALVVNGPSIYALPVR
ncbi:PQQ-binding-like beta-propeller repeat protein [Streptomyces sp. NPDC047525]|uniref:outer membrane protein assembly factor BamB family protein n=1 Tax=Streptomyces sp. NPDC047525 TaxID=3155264 RepID=UPI003401AE63